MHQQYISLSIDNDLRLFLDLNTEVLAIEIQECFSEGCGNYCFDIAHIEFIVTVFVLVDELDWNIRDFVV